MDLESPRWVDRAELFAARPGGCAGARLEGLWVAGGLEGLALRTVGVVGTRAPSEAARQRAHEVGRRLAQAGVCVLSGLALGVDGAAHAGALEGGGPTIGVLGGGHRHFFPPRNRKLAERMLARGGAVLSPYAPDEHAWPGNFLQRNGIVVALADAVVIVEAAARSGALNTASWAAARGIPVLVFPGDVDRPKAAGCNALIRDGATLVRDAGDILDDLGLSVGEPATVSETLATMPPRGALEMRLLGELNGAPRLLDELIERSGGDSGAILAALVRLEIDGVVDRRGDGTIVRVR